MARKDCVHYEIGIAGYCSPEMHPRSCGCVLCPNYATEQSLPSGYNPPPPDSKPPEKPSSALPSKVEPTSPQPPWYADFPQLRGLILFVRAGDDIPLLFDDFIAFAVRENYLVGIDRQYKRVNEIREYDNSEEAQAALDTIQAALDCWNRVATEPKHNVRLISITENLEYPAAKKRMKETFSEMGIDSSDGKTTVQLWQVWAALSGMMLLTEDFNVP